MVDFRNVSIFLKVKNFIGFKSFLEVVRYLFFSTLNFDLHLTLSKGGLLETCIMKLGLVLSVFLVRPSFFTIIN